MDGRSPPGTETPERDPPGPRNGGRRERGGSNLEPPHFSFTDAPELGESPDPPGIPAGRRLESEPYLTPTVVLTVPPFTDE